MTDCQACFPGAVLGPLLAVDPNFLSRAGEPAGPGLCIVPKG
jgi:hypothetical protein